MLIFTKQRSHSVPITRKKIIFEADNSRGDSIVSISSNPNNEKYTNYSCIALGCVVLNFWGYTIGCSIISSNPYDRNYVDGYNHIVLDYFDKTVTVINAITNNIVLKFDIAGYVNNFLSSGVVYVGFDCVQTVNPDIQSFKYKPNTDYDIDLYSHVLNLPFVKPKPKTNYTGSNLNIL